MAFQMQMPDTDGDDVQKSLRRIRSWLYRLNENLQYAFSNLDEENFTDSFLKTLGVGESPTLTEQVRALSERMDAAEAEPEPEPEAGVWTPLTVLNASAWSGSYVPRYRKSGSIVYLTGAIALSAPLASQNAIIVGIMPEGFRPSFNASLCVASDAGAARLTVDSGGVMALKNITDSPLTTSGFISIDGSFLT